MKRKISVYDICFTALAVVINIVGGQIALTLRLPIYLDSIGTIMTGAVLGPVFGMVPNLLSGIIMGMTVDIYSLYFAPVGMIVGFMSAIVFRWRRKKLAKIGDTASMTGMKNKGWIVAGAAAITVPGTILSAVICTVLFGGVTSSGSSVLVQLLAKTPIGMTGSIIAVQIVTDYLDRIISLVLVLALLRVLPGELVHPQMMKFGQKSCHRCK